MSGGDDERHIYSAETFRIRGAMFQVYRALGPGFLEAVYQEALALEFARSGIPFEAGARLGIRYKGALLKQAYVADFICFDRIVVELKSVRALAPEHRAQTLNYLRATDHKLGLLANFGSEPKMEIERFAL